MQPRSALFLLVSMLASAGAAAAPQAVAPAPDSTSAGLAGQQCAIGEEKFLPADYYYCLASQAYGQGQYPRALKFFTTAASWASKPAQYVLGVMALHGDHQKPNPSLALAWLSLAAERKQADFTTAYAQAYAAASPDQREKTAALLQQMRPTYADATAAPRAEERYRQGMAQFTRAGSGADVHCVEGVVPIGWGANGTNSTVACVHAPELAQAIDRKAAEVFDGWQGHVSVGALQPVGPKPTTTTSR